MVVVHPSGEVWVGICFNELVDVGLGREPRWFTTNVLPPVRLIHTYVVNLQMHREREVVQVNDSEIFGHPQVKDNVLKWVLEYLTALHQAHETHHWFL